MQSGENVRISHRCRHEDGIAMGEKRAAGGLVSCRAVENYVFLVAAVGEIRAHVIYQVAVIGRTRIQKKVLIFQHAETRIFETAQGITARLLHVEINQFDPGIRVQGRNAQARHERQGALANSALRIGKYYRARLGQI